MINRINLARIPIRQVEQVFLRARDALQGHLPPYVEEAPDAIAKIRGFGSHRDLARSTAQAIGSALRLTDLRAIPIVEGANLVATLMQTEAGNYLRVPFEYVPIEIVMRLLDCKMPELAGVQLACNFGPYLHYLANVRGTRQFKGLDIDKVAVQYAQAAGIDVAEGSAAEMPFTHNSQELIVSQNFLSLDYLNEPDIVNILREVARVLKPGGYFISNVEDLPYCLSNELFESTETFPAEIWHEVPCLRDIKLLRKAS